MKYGETLRQRSIPAWSHHNIDYEDIKHFIKEQTTPGAGKSVSIPGRGNDKLADFETALFRVLQDQHERIDLFVQSKSGEIQRRIDHAKRQLKQLSSRRMQSADSKIPIRRLERYSRLENDVLKAGDDIRSLARFVSAQKTAFRKLLKKYKKWTGSVAVENRFHKEVLDSPKSFTQLDLTLVLNDYSETIQNIRRLYEDGVRPSTPASKRPPSSGSATSSLPAKLTSMQQSKSKVEFDTALATVPLGKDSSLATYFVHPENTVELQVLLLQYSQYFTPKSRSNSNPSLLQSDMNTKNMPQNADYFMIDADKVNRFGKDESALTVNEREHAPRFQPQRARASIRWNLDEDAVVTVRADGGIIKSASLKRKNVESFFDKNVPVSNRKDSAIADTMQSAALLRDEILKDSKLQPLYRISSRRSRFVGHDNGSNNVVLASLDDGINMRRHDGNADYNFPFAVLQVRSEGSMSNDLISSLDRSHLVERVRGFSLQYHALWQLYTPDHLAKPFWIPILSRDIRKLPGPAASLTGNPTAASSGTQSATKRSASTPDGTTAVETAATSSSTIPDQLRAPPLRSFRKRRRRAYPNDSHQKYWSEYDHPEAGSTDGDAYVLYFDPDEKSTLDRLFARVSGLFRSPQEQEEDALLPPPSAPEDEETSSDEEAVQPRQAGYGTLASTSTPRIRSMPGSQRHYPPFLPPMTSICLFASLALLVVAYILATTSKHKYATEVDAGILFAVGCSLAFAVVGSVPLVMRKEGSWLSLGVAVTILLLDAVCSGALLARIVG